MWVKEASFHYESLLCFFKRVTAECGLKKLPSIMNHFYVSITSHSSASLTETESPILVTMIATREYQPDLFSASDTTLSTRHHSCNLFRKKELNLVTFLTTELY
jgi:hypothetical protein